MSFILKRKYVTPCLNARHCFRSSRMLSQIWTPDNKIVGGEMYARKPENKLLKQLVDRIRFGGPITVAQYMQELLTHPREGYYMKKDVFGTQGDFITSPEISQMFGESLAVWIFLEWKKMGAPTPLQLVELGPGRGTLMQDLLRTLTKLSPALAKEIHVHLVEASPYLRKFQEVLLCGSDQKDKSFVVSKYGSKVSWYDSVDQIPPNVFTIFVANEFFDALPVHKFARVKMAADGGLIVSDDEAKSVWREILIDVDEKESGLRFTVARHRTPANQFIERESFYMSHESAEISLKSGVIIKEISRRIVEDGGFALIADYGHDGSSAHGDTLRAFKNHKLHDPLVEPGTADITVDVDFSYLSRHCDEAAMTYGAVTQREFLFQLGIEVRLQQLLKFNSSKEELCAELKSGFDYLTDPEKMGERFKFLSIFPKTMLPIHLRYPPIGFHQNNKK